MTSQLHLYTTPPHPCNYLGDHQATTVFIDPNMPKDMNLYEILSQHGFRRSGEYLYRPHCHGCEACIPVRVPVNLFAPNRTQRRIWKRNQDLVVSQVPACYKQEYYQLYSRYINTRHIGGGMDNPNIENYKTFLICSWADTVFYEFRLDNQLVAVATVDVFSNGLSAVYTYFDPELEARSLGTFAVLWEIEQCKQQGLEWLYLGYFIKACRKMRYKVAYQPLEYYYHGVWQTMSKENLEIF